MGVTQEELLEGAVTDLATASEELARERDVSEALREHLATLTTSSSGLAPRDLRYGPPRHSQCLAVFLHHDTWIWRCLRCSVDESLASLSSLCCVLRQPPLL